MPRWHCVRGPEPSRPGLRTILRNNGFACLRGARMSCCVLSCRLPQGAQRDQEHVMTVCVRQLRVGRLHRGRGGSVSSTPRRPPMRHGSRTFSAGSGGSATPASSELGRYGGAVAVLLAAAAAAVIISWPFGRFARRYTSSLDAPFLRWTQRHVSGARVVAPHQRDPHPHGQPADHQDHRSGRGGRLRDPVGASRLVDPAASDGGRAGVREVRPDRRWPRWSTVRRWPCRTSAPTRQAAARG